MIKIAGFNISQISPTFMQVSWYLEPTTENLTLYVVNVYRGELPSTNISDYTLLTVPSLPANEFTEYYDTGIAGITNKFDTYSYLIQILDLSGNLVTASNPATLTTVGDYAARRIIQLRELVLKKKSGANFTILKRKTYGTLCPVCYDPTLQLPTNSKCLTCYDTKFVGGFYSPYVVRAQINKAPSRSIILVYGSWEDEDSVLVMSNKPVIAPGDMIIDPLSKRWNVITVRSVNKSSFIIAQQAQMRLIELDSILYNVPG